MEALDYMRKTMQESFDPGDRVDVRSVLSDSKHERMTSVQLVIFTNLKSNSSYPILFPN